jgi:1,2-diacylglycerol 3-alpha-glucosyltransferase
MVAACPFPSPQGSQVLVRQLCERLAARGHDVELLTYGQGPALTSQGYQHHRTRRLPGDAAARSGPTPIKPMLDAFMVARLGRMLADDGSAPFDVVHCHNYEGALVGLAARLRYGVPVLYHSHNLMADELPTYFGNWAAQAAAARLGSALDAAVPSRADHAIALCDYTADVMRRGGVAEDRLSVIPPGLEDEGPAECAVAARTRAKGIISDGAPPGPDDYVVGYCGNLDAYQNLELLLDGFADLVGRGGARPPLLLVATHARDDAFARAVERRGLVARVRVCEVSGYDDARTAMEACDALVLPRRSGSGYPVKLLNYLSLGRPVVTAGCGAKLIRHGEDGLVVGDDDPSGLADALAVLAPGTQLASRLGAAGRERFLAELTWDAVLPAVEDAYRAVVRRAAGVKAAQAV